MSLKALKKELEEKAAARAEREANGGNFKKPLRDYEVLKEFGEIDFRVAQELDTDAKNYDPTIGTGMIAIIHQVPFGQLPFRAAKCTSETEGKCYGCERAADRDDEKAKEWRARQTVYFNAVARINGERKIVLFSQPVNRDIVAFLIKYGTKKDTITNVVLNMSKTGAKKDTRYPVMQDTDADLADYSLDGLELFPMDQAIASIEYAKQAAFYGGTSASSEETATPVAVNKPAATSDEDW